MDIKHSCTDLFNINSEILEILSHTYKEPLFVKSYYSILNKRVVETATKFKKFLIDEKSTLLEIHYT